MQEPREVNVFVLAENRLLRESLVRFLVKRTGIRVVGTSHCSSASLQQLASSSPHIVLLDSIAVGGVCPRLIPSVRQCAPAASIVMVGMNRDEKKFLQCVVEGCVGYVLQDACALEVAVAIQGVIHGEAVFPTCLSMSLFRCVAQRSNLSGLTGGCRLSRRQMEVVALVRAGLANKEIASRLNLSEQTVKNHVHRIFRKVGVGDRIQLAEQWIPSELSSGASASS
jgi:DNA-binding NarL/FixJ family response regulator